MATTKKKAGTKKTTRKTTRRRDMSQRLKKEFLDKWGPTASKLEFQGKKIMALGENDLRALLAYEAHRDAALNSALTEQTRKLTTMINETIKRGGLRGWLCRRVLGGQALARIKKAGVAL